MSFLVEVNCSSILEAIRNEKKNQKENENGDDYVLLLKVNTFWTDLFARCFLCDSNRSSSQYNDDMLFFVTKPNNNVKMDRIQVYRCDSKRLPCLTDLNYDWEETIYLNLILHEFEYTLTCAICTQTSSKDLQILKRHSKKVYASPSRRDLKSKGSEEVITYPNIYFTIDDFDEAFNEMIVNEGEMVCVELVANDGKMNKVLFLGSIKYESLKKVYDTRASVSMKLAQKVSLGAYNENKRVEFVKMRGPLSKGYAEMAVSRHKSQKIGNTTQSMPSTPTSESFNDDFFKNKNSTNNSSSWSNWKFSNLNLNLNKQSILKTPEVETRDFREDLNDANNSNDSFWNRTFGQAFSWIKKNDPINDSMSSNTEINDSSISLNAYLTYVNLSLQTIIQDALDSQQKSVLTF